MSITVDQLKPVVEFIDIKAIDPNEWKKLTALTTVMYRVEIDAQLGDVTYEYMLTKLKHGLLSSIVEYDAYCNNIIDDYLELTKKYRSKLYTSVIYNVVNLATTRVGILVQMDIAVQFPNTDLETFWQLCYK